MNQLIELYQLKFMQREDQLATERVRYEIEREERREEHQRQMQMQQLQVQQQLQMNAHDAGYGCCSNCKSKPPPNNGSEN